MSVAVSKTARILLHAGEPALAERYLTYVTNTELIKALDSAEQLACALDVRSRALHATCARDRLLGPEQIW